MIKISSQKQIDSNIANTINLIKKKFLLKYIELFKRFPQIHNLKNREFAYLSWDKNFMVRHEGYIDNNQLFNRIKNIIPRHIYASAALYEEPNAKKMEDKRWIGCDFVMDIDADHFELECNNVHDYNFCSNCSYMAKGTPPPKCPNCGTSKWIKQNWLCDNCLNVAKKEVYKILQFLINDIGILEEEIFIKFSGNRGYHIEVISEKIKKLDSEARREITDYLTGTNLIIDFRVNNFNAPTKLQYGWKEKIVKKFYEILKEENSIIFKNSKNPIIEPHLIQLLFREENRKYLLTQINNNNSNWNILGIGAVGWKKIFEVIINEIKCNIDIPVSIDIHRLLRLKGSINGKTGFLSIPLDIKKELDNFNPLLDSVIFNSNDNPKLNMKIKITSLEVPQIKINDILYGPFKKDDIIEVPESIGVFFICKDVAIVI